MFTNINEPLNLDLTRYKNSPSTYALAEVVAEETEAQRLAEGGTRHGTTTLGALMRLEPSELAKSKHWYDFVSDSKVLRRCAVKLAIDRTILLERIRNELSPPNWETLFWMQHYLEAIGESIQAEQLAEALQSKLIRAAEIQQTNAIKGGRRNHQKKYGVAKEFVLKEWKLHGQSAYLSNKSEFARAYVPLVLKECERQVTERTIAISWLRDM